MSNTLAPKKSSIESNSKSNPNRSKKDIIVSVRLPRSLVDELKDIQKINHFMDLSDEIRFVVRRYCLSFLNTKGQFTQSPMDALVEQKNKEKLIDELTRIIDSLKTTSSSASIQNTVLSNIQTNNIAPINKNNTGKYE